MFSTRSKQIVVERKKENLNGEKARWEELHENEIKIKRELHRWLRDKAKREVDTWEEEVQSLSKMGIMMISKSKLQSNPKTLQLIFLTPL